MGFGLNIAQPATSGFTEALSTAYTSPITTQVESGNFNFGEIIKPYIQGSPENGGYDVVVPSRLAVTPASSLANSNSGLYPAEKNIVQKYGLYMVLAGGVGFVIYKMLKR